MSTEEYTGVVAGMKTSPWLASEDIDGLGDVKVTIEAVYKHENVTMQDGRKQPRLFAIKFAGKTAQMIVNATNRKTLSSAFGADVRQWKGKTVYLYVQDGVKKPGGASGETCKGLRIRTEDVKA